MIIRIQAPLHELRRKSMCEHEELRSKLNSKNSAAVMTKSLQENMFWSLKLEAKRMFFCNSVCSKIRKFLHWLCFTDFVYCKSLKKESKRNTYRQTDISRKYSWEIFRPKINFVQNKNSKITTAIIFPEILLFGDSL